jgi:hypothetical protein
MRFPYSTTDPAQDAFDSLPRLPLRLRADSRALDVMGLVDSGAMVNVLPYDVGLQLGVVWDERRANIRLAGTLGQQQAMPVFMIAEIADFAPVRLAFAWVQSPDAPLILGQTNFFMEFEVCFYRSSLEFEVKPKSSI